MPPFHLFWWYVALIAVGAVPILIVVPIIAMMRRRLSKKSSRLITAIATAVFLLVCLGLFTVLLGGDEVRAHFGGPVMIGWLLEAGLGAISVIVCIRCRCGKVS